MGKFVHREIELAWAAGFFDGEGCFKGARTNGLSDKKYGRISISQKDSEVLYRFKSAVGELGSVNGPYNNMWYYVATRKADIIVICELLRPYLSSIKVADMDNMLTNIKNIQEYKPRLSKEEVVDIRHQYDSIGMTMQELGEKFGRSAGHISDIVNRRKWANV